MGSNEGKGAWRRKAARPCISAVIAAAACGVAWAAAGWACVPQSALLVSPVGSGPPGTKVTVAGYRFGESPVELRWNSLDGPLLAKATGPDFQAGVTIPSDSNGLNTIVGFVRAPDGSVGTVIQVVQFNVTGPGAVASKPATSSSTAAHATAGWSTGAVVAALGAVLLIGLIVGGLGGRRHRRGSASAAGGGGVASAASASQQSTATSGQ